MGMSVYAHRSPELEGYLPCQQSLLQASLKLLSGAPSPAIEHMSWGVFPREIYAEIGSSSLGDMLFDPKNPINSAFDKVPEVGKDTVSDVSCGATALWIRRLRLIEPADEVLYDGRNDVRISDNPPDPRVRRADFSPKVDWRGEVHLTFRHDPGEAPPLFERLAICDNHNYPGRMPIVTSSLYIARGDDCARSERPVENGEEVSEFLGVVDSLRPKQTQASSGL